MQYFAFDHAHTNMTRKTRFSRENQLLLKEAFNANKTEIEVYHEIQYGPRSLDVIKYIVNFPCRTVTNNENNAVHRLVMD